MRTKTAGRILGVVAAALWGVLPGIADAQGARGCNSSMLRGQYIFTATGYTRANPASPWVPKAILEFTTFNGDGTYVSGAITLANPFGNLGTIFEVPPGGTGTYTVNADCTGTLGSADGVTFKMYVVPPRADAIWMLQTTGLGGTQGLNVFQGKAERIW